MITSLKTIGKPAEEILSFLRETLARRLPTQDTTSNGLETSGLGYAGWLGPVLTAQDGTRTRIRCPFVIDLATMNLCRTVAESERGAWTRAHLRMSADELRLHLCDTQYIPGWLAQGAKRAHAAPPPYPDENEGVHQTITEQERGTRHNS